MRALGLLVLAAAACAPTATSRGPTCTAGDAPVVVVDPLCTDNGCLQSIIDIGSFTRGDIAPALEPGVVLDNGYRVLTIAYATDGASSTATVTLPVDLHGDAPTEGFPVVVNAHGTVGLEDPCRLSSTISGAGLAGLFGGRGAVGIAPDYPGLGTPGLQRYLDSESEGAAVLDAVRAALNLARHEGTPVSGRAAAVGLSQGGHAVLAAASMQARYAPELDMRAYGAAAPATAWEEQWRPGIEITGAHIPNVALLVWSFAQQTGSATEGIFVPALAGSVDDLMRTRCMWSPSFTSEPTLPDAISSVPSEVFTDAFRAAFSTGDFRGSAARFAFVHERFTADRLAPFAQTVPIRIWQGTDDTTVLPSMTEALVTALDDAGMTVELTEVPGGTHTTTAFGFLASHERATDESVAWIEARLKE